MPTANRNSVIRSALIVLISVLIVGGFLAGKYRISEAFPGMPAAQKAYIEWISSINEGSGSAIDQGLLLLTQFPDHPLLYRRLPGACLEAGAQDVCYTAIHKARPVRSPAVLYREAALAQLSPKQTRRAQYVRLAGSAFLDGTVARLIVDKARADRENPWLDEVERIWRARSASDTTCAGVSFGLGYVAALRNEPDSAETYLLRAARLDPDNVEAFRELGRIYYQIGKAEAFDRYLKAGLSAAARTYDLEQELVLQGNYGLGLLQRGSLDEAEASFLKALVQSRALSDRTTEGFNYYRLAGVRLKQYRYDQALALLDSASVLYERYAPRQQPELQALRGMALRALFRFSDAEHVLEETILAADTLGNVGVRIQAAVSLAQLRHRMGRYNAARSMALEALGIASSYQQADLEIASLMAVGDTEMSLGNVDAASSHYVNGLRRAEETASLARQRELNMRLGVLLLNIHDAPGAQSRFENLLETARQEAEPKEMAQVYFGLGNTYAQFGNYTESIRHYDLALQTIRETFSAPTDRVLELNVLITKAWDLTNLARYEEAEAALARARELAAGDASLLYRTEVALGNLFYSSGRHDEALRRLNAAEAFKGDVKRPLIHWLVLHEKALIYWERGEPKKAEVAFRKAVELIETLRDNLESSDSRSSFVQNKVVVFKDYAAFLREQGRDAEAFALIERARSRSLVDLLYTTQQERRLAQNDPTAMMIEMQRRIRALEQEMAEADPAAEAAPNQRAGATRSAVLEREYAAADSMYRHAQSRLGAHQRMYSFRPLGLDSVRAMLRRDEALVVFSLPSEEGALVNRERPIAFVVQPTGIETLELAFDTGALFETIRFFRDQITDANGGPGKGWEPTSKRLHQLLMAPVIERLLPTVRHVHIVPEGALHYVPFAALLDGSGRFLTERFTLSVAPSASILSLCRRNNPRQWRTMLLVGDPDGKLPGSRKEVLEIARRSPGRRTTLLGNAATTASLDTLAWSFDVIHFATHGHFVSRSPWLSHLEMYGDNELTVDEIGRLRLDAYLVTLSACETALSGGRMSDIPRGDEWIGLNQAFLAAGAPTVMASLWPIDDMVSSRFMTGFYDHLKMEGKARALSAIQRAFIRDAKTKHPYYWAAFTIIGDPL